MGTTSIAWRVGVGDDEVSAVFDPSDKPDAPVFVCAHGAGGNLADRGVVRTAQVLREHGMHTVRFNFAYRERKSSRPDPMPKLTACLAEVVRRVRAELDPHLLIIGGRSMGGRAASMLASGGFPCDGLLLLAYPLHPPGRPQQLRSAHLPAIRVPVLCINGTRDDFCTRSLMEEVLTTVPKTWQMHWIEGADHSFHVLKSSGRHDDDVMQEIGAVSATWVTSLR
ncbi:MAG TPA: alpha/beta family hydrolase [Gemmatimonadaceae bacterium]